MVAGQEINFPGQLGGWVAGWGGGIRNKAQLRPAKLELGLGLSLAKKNFQLREG